MPHGSAFLREGEAETQRAREATEGERAIELETGVGEKETLGSDIS